MAIYTSQRNERHLYVERDLDAALARLSEPAFGYDLSEKCWIIDEYDQVHRHLAHKGADLLWNHDDFGRDLVAMISG